MRPNLKNKGKDDPRLVLDGSALEQTKRRVVVVVVMAAVEVGEIEG